MSATPTKRRALGALDVNVTRSPRSPRSPSSSLSSKLVTKGPVCAGGGASPLKKKPAMSHRHATPSPPRKDTTPPPKKRLLEAGEGAPQPPVKKLCSESPPPEASSSKDADEDEPLALQPATTMTAAVRRSISPDASSLFDNSAMINTSQFTTITEPDTDAPITATAAAAAAAAVPAVPVLGASSAVLDILPILPPPRPRRVPTREEFRQKAEILKLRLSLATYKVKTNQTDVPLDQLQIRPVPGMSRRRTPLPSMSAHTIQRATPAQYWYRSSQLVQRGNAEAGDDAGDEEEEEEEEKAEQNRGAADAADAGGASSLLSLEKNTGLPEMPRPVVSTPKRYRNAADEEVWLTSSALRGGAAKGLLSLSQGSL